MSFFSVSLAIASEALMRALCLIFDKFVQGFFGLAYVRTFYHHEQP